jgi:hypothetical protein
MLPLLCTRIRGTAVSRADRAGLYHIPHVANGYRVLTSLQLVTREYEIGEGCYRAFDDLCPDAEPVSVSISLRDEPAGDAIFSRQRPSM